MTDDDKKPPAPPVRAAKAPSNPEPEPLLSAAEIEKIKEDVRADILAEKKAAAAKAMKAKLRVDLMKTEGLVTGSTVEDEMVNITLDLAPHSADVTINGRHYPSGRVHTVPRHVARVLSEVQMRGWDHENEIKSGKSRLHNMQNRHDTRVSPVGVVNPPRQTFG